MTFQHFMHIETISVREINHRITNYAARSYIIIIHRNYSDRFTSNFDLYETQRIVEYSDVCLNYNTKKQIFFSFICSAVKRKTLLDLMEIFTYARLYIIRAVSCGTTAFLFYILFLSLKLERIQSEYIISFIG